MSKVSKLKKLGIMLIVSGMLMSMLTACGGSKTAAADDTKDNNTTAQTDAQDQTDPDENYETGDASLDDPLNQDEIGDTELLVVSFGTSYNDSRRETIGAIEKAMQKAFPDYAVRRGFTSQIIIDHVNKRDGEKIDNVTEALDRAVDNKVKTLVVQPTHLMNGLEYNDLKDELAGCFREMRPYEGKCRFRGCSHTKEAGCAVLEAVKNGEISQSRHQSYVNLYELAKNIKEWEIGR